jgi:hypothetical protein
MPETGRPAQRDSQKMKPEQRLVENIHLKLRIFARLAGPPAKIKRRRRPAMPRRSD